MLSAVAAGVFAMVATEKSESARQAEQSVKERLAEAQRFAAEILAGPVQELETVPNSQGVQKQLMEAIAGYTEKLTKQGINDQTTLDLDIIQNGLKGNLALGDGNLKVAEEAFVKALEKIEQQSERDNRHNHVVILKKLAVVLDRGGNFKDAQSKYKEAIKLLPVAPRAALLIEQSRYEEAIKLLVDSPVDPKDPQSKQDLVGVLESMAELKKRMNKPDAESGLR